MEPKLCFAGRKPLSTENFFLPHNFTTTSSLFVFVFASVFVFVFVPTLFLNQVQFHCSNTAATMYFNSGSSFLILNIVVISKYRNGAKLSIQKRELIEKLYSSVFKHQKVKDRLDAEADSAPKVEIGIVCYLSATSC